MHKISELLPYDIIRYIYEILSATIIQSVFRKNKPVGNNVTIGTRVLVLFNNKYKYQYGTIDKIGPLGPNYGHHFKYRIRLVSGNIYPQRCYYYSRSHSLNGPRKIIFLNPWRDTKFCNHQVKGLFGIF